MNLYCLPTHGDNNWIELMIPNTKAGIFNKHLCHNNEFIIRIEMNDFRYELLKNDADEFLIKHNSIYKTKGIKQNVVFILHIGATFTVIYSDFDMHEELCQEVIYIFTQHLLLMNGVFGLGNQYLRADEQEQANRRIPFFKVRLDARITNEKFGTKLYN